MSASESQQRRWQDALLIAKILTIDPGGLGGVWLKSSVGPVRDYWLDYFKRGVDTQIPVIKIPHHADETALLGGLDLLQTLQLQHKVYTLGLLSQAASGVVILSMAERLQVHTAACITQAFDATHQFGLIALDESMGSEEEQLLPRIQERLAFKIEFDDLSYRDCQAEYQPYAIEKFRESLAQIEVPDVAIEAITTAAQGLGIDSLRAIYFAIRASKVIAALRGGDQLTQEDIQTATQLVFAHRITALPQQTPANEQSSDQENIPQEESPPSEKNTDSKEDDTHQDESNEDTSQNMPLSKDQLEEMIIEASKAYLPKGVLDSLMEQQKVVQTQENSQGKVGQLKKGLHRGQSLPSRQGKLDRSKKLDLLKTIQAASPWQTIRRQELGIGRDYPKIMIRSEDIYLKRYVMRSTSVTLFVVDASGSSALERLGEAKGAVELLLAQCYIRRDQVAMMTFRGNQVNLILTPTRSLVRAKRLLAAMPGGGGTPLASAIQTSTQYATQLKRKGQTPVLVMMTDGRANVTAAGVGGREQAYADALMAAQRAKNENLNILFVDTSFKTQEANQIIAQQMGAKYILLPQGKSSAVVEAAKQLVV